MEKEVLVIFRYVEDNYSRVYRRVSTKLVKYDPQNISKAAAIEKAVNSFTGSLKGSSYITNIKIVK